MATNQAQAAHTFFWHRLPLAVARIARYPAFLLADGDYLAALIPRMAYGHGLACLLGFLFGAFRWGFATDNIFTASLLVMGIFYSVAAFSAAWGCFLTLGYALGHVFYFVWDMKFGHNSGLWLRMFAHLIEYCLMFFMLCNIPYLGRLFGTAGGIVLHRRVTHEWLLTGLFTGLVTAAFMVMWTHATPIMVRAVTILQSKQPSVAMMAPLQVYGWVLAVLAFAASMLRSWLEWRSKQIDMAEQVLAQYQTRQAILALGPSLLQRQPAWLAILAKTLFLTFLFAGLYAHWMDAVLLGGCIGGMLVVRSNSIKPLQTWAQWLRPMPILLRLVLSSIGAYFMTRWIITTWWDSAGGFRPVLVSCLLSILILYLLLPELEPKLRAGGKAKGD